MAYKATQTLCLTADQKTVVAEGDPAARWLLVSKGCELPLPVARAYGLVDGDNNPVDLEAKAVTEPPAHKAVIMPAEVKRTRTRKSK